MRLIGVIGSHKGGRCNVCCELEDELRELLSDRGAFVLVSLAVQVFLVFWVEASVNGALSDDAVEYIVRGVVLPHTIALVEPMLVLAIALSAWHRERPIVGRGVTFVDAVRLTVAKSLVYSSVFMLNSIILLGVCRVWYGTVCDMCVVVTVVMLMLYIVLVLCVGFMVAYLLRSGRVTVAIACVVMFILVSPGGAVADMLGTMCSIHGVCVEVARDAMVVLVAVVVAVLVAASADMSSGAN